jgi:hypothetical protein
MSLCCNCELAAVSEPLSSASTLGQPTLEEPFPHDRDDREQDLRRDLGGRDSVDSLRVSSSGRGDLGGGHWQPQPCRPRSFAGRFVDVHARRGASGLGCDGVLDYRRHPAAGARLRNASGGYSVHSDGAGRPAVELHHLRQGEARTRRRPRPRLRLHRRPRAGTADRHSRSDRAEAEDALPVARNADRSAKACRPVSGADQSVRRPAGDDHRRGASVQRRRTQGSDRCGAVQSDHADSDRPGAENPRRRG